MWRTKCPRPSVRERMRAQLLDTSPLSSSLARLQWPRMTPTAPSTARYLAPPAAPPAITGRAAAPRLDVDAYAPTTPPAAAPATLGKASAAPAATPSRVAPPSNASPAKALLTSPVGAPSTPSSPPTRPVRLLRSAADAAATTCEGVRRAPVVLAPALRPTAAVFKVRASRPASMRPAPPRPAAPLRRGFAVACVATT